MQADARAATAPIGLGAAAAPLRGRGQVQALVALTGFMTVLDGSIVGIALPSIADEYNVSISGPMAWVQIGYLVVIAASLMTLGRLSDLTGRRPVLLVGLAIFTTGSVLCGVSPTLGLLIAARAAQGLGAAMMLAVGPALLADYFPVAERGRVLGTNAITGAVATSIGPTLGGFIIDSLTWRWIFLVNVPFGVAAFVAAWHILKRRQDGRARVAGPVHFDPLGALLLGLGPAALTLGLSFAHEWGRGSPRLLACLAVGVVSLVLAAVVERRVPAPLLDLDLFRSRMFTLSLVSLMLSMVGFVTVGFMLPFYFEELRGLSTSTAGLLLTPLAVALAVTAPLSGTLADRYGSRWLAPVGLGCSCLGLLALSQLGTTAGAADVAWRLVLVGVGQGLFQSPTTRAMMAAATSAEQGEASGVQGTARVVAQGLGVALASAVFAVSGGAAAGATLAATESGVGLPPAQVDALHAAFLGGYQATLLACAVVVGIGTVVSLLRGRDA